MASRLKRLTRYLKGGAVPDYVRRDVRRIVHEMSNPSRKPKLNGENGAVRLTLTKALETGQLDALIAAVRGFVGDAKLTLQFLATHAMASRADR